MSVTRRELLTAGAAGAVLVGCAPLAQRISAKTAPFEPPTRVTDPSRRLIDRLTFGPRPGQVSEVAELGEEAWIKRELAADRPEEFTLPLQLHRLDALWGDPHELWDVPEDVIVRQLQQAAILRAVHGANGLQERLADFWTNHFNIYGRKGLAAFRLGRDIERVIRPNVLGNFGKMLRASAHSPAMLYYLDNPSNMKGVPNENYARELMELHSLGVNGGYTQKDVREVARCFTGWRVERRFLRHRGAFIFDPAFHDDGEKFVLGHRIPAGGGEKDAEFVLDLLSTHPETAKFVCTKLARAFVGDDASQHVPDMAKRFLDSGGEIRPVLEPLLLSRAMHDSPPILKRPLDFVASAVRAVGAKTDGGVPVQERLATMGQPLYQWPMPDGFPTEPEAWAGSTLGRWNFALALAANQIGGTRIDWAGLAPASADAAAAAVLGRRVDGLDLDGKPETAVAMALCHPEFQWR